MAIVKYNGGAWIEPFDFFLPNYAHRVRIHQYRGSAIMFNE